ncbi:MAG: S8 family serine peptidase [Bacteroidota bacterium]
MRTLILLLLAVPSLVWAQTPGKTLAPHVPNRVVVKFSEAPASLGKAGIEQRLPFDATELQAVTLLHEASAAAVLDFNGLDTKTALERLAGLPGIEYAEPDFIGEGAGRPFVSLAPYRTPASQLIPNDPFFSRQWNLLNDGSRPGSRAGADVSMPDAWALTTGSEDVVLAILDSGFNMDHPEFDGRLWTNAGEVAGNGIDDDGNGYVDDINGFDFVNEDGDPSDDHGHGSNVGAIAAMTGNNGIGLAGLDWSSRVMTLKILNSNNFGSYSDWTEAIRYAADAGADVINLSVGGSGYSRSMEDAVNYAHAAGVFLAASMMNTNESRVFYPAGYANVFAVGATDDRDARADPFFWSPTSGSNFGDHIDVVAPGNEIYGLTADSNTQYSSYWGGTSQASPHVAGLAALLKALDPQLTPNQIADRIRQTADDGVGDAAEDAPGFDPYYGYGRINAARALETVVSTSTEETPAPFELSVYPNPTSGPLRIITDQPVTVDLFDVTGRKLRTQRGTRTTVLNVTDLPAGAYLLSISSPEASVTRLITKLD